MLRWISLKISQQLATYMASKVNRDRSNIQEAVRAYTGISLSGQEVSQIKDAKYIANLINDIMSKKAGIGWRTIGHNNNNVFLYAVRENSDLFRGILDNDNTDIPKEITEAMNNDF